MRRTCPGKQLQEEITGTPTDVSGQGTRLCYQQQVHQVIHIAPSLPSRNVDCCQVRGWGEDPPGNRGGRSPRLLRSLRALYLDELCQEAGVAWSNTSPKALKAAVEYLSEENVETLLARSFRVSKRIQVCQSDVDRVGYVVLQKIR